MLRRLVPVPIKLVLILVGNDVHIASMEFLECFSHSRLLIINNRALAGQACETIGHCGKTLPNPPNKH